jgi:hypothetical protein
MTQDVLAKIASVVLSTEDGITFVENALTKAAGVEAAKETFEFLQHQAAYAQGQRDAEAMIYNQIEQQEMQKQAEYLQGRYDAQLLAQRVMDKRAAATHAPGLRKLGQQVADESMANAGGMGGGLGGEAAGAADMMGSAPQDEEISPEELEAALAELVQEGQITPEAAQAIIQAIQAAEQGGQPGAEGGMPPEAAGGQPGMEGSPGSEGSAESSGEASKEAMAKAAALVAAISKQRAAQK